MEEKRQILKKLFKIQDEKCLFCEKNIKFDPTMDLHEFHKEYEVDHIVPFSEIDSRDDDSNWAILHKIPCNRKKSNKPLFLAKYIFNFEKDKEIYGDSFTLGKVLEIKGFDTKPLFIRFTDELAELKFQDLERDREIETFIYKDPTGTGTFESFFVILPIEYIYHDFELNPRPIGENVPKLITEFFQENTHPQLHVCLARLEKAEQDNYWKVLLFDGQHKAVAQIYNKKKQLLLRIFRNGDKELLKQTNFHAHTILRQIEFFRSIAARVGSGMFAEKFKDYLETGGLEKSEKLFLTSQKPIERNSIKNEFKGWLRHGILHGEEVDSRLERNLMTPYIEEERSRKRGKPISYDSFNKTFIKNFVYSRLSEDKIDVEGEDYFRTIERKNVIKLMSIIAETILIEKFDLKLGAHKLEQRLRKSESIPDPHVKAYRIFRPKSFETWMGTLQDAIKTLLKHNRTISDIYANQGKIFWNELEEKDWIEISKMLDRIFNHKIWLLKSSRIINAIGSSKKEICEKLLLTGKVDDDQEIDTPIDFKYVMGV